MSKLHRLTDAFAYFLQPGEELVLDVKGAKGIVYIRHGIAQIDLQNSGLKDGDICSFISRESRYKKGEGTHLGWALEVSGNEKRYVVHEYFTVSSNLFSELSRRKESSGIVPDSQHHYPFTE